MVITEPIKEKRKKKKTFVNSHTWEKANFNHRPWKIKEKTMLQSVRINSGVPSNQTCFVFFSLRWSWPHRITVALLIRCTNSDESQIPSPHHGFGIVSNAGNVISPFIFTHDHLLNIGRRHQFAIGFDACGHCPTKADLRPYGSLLRLGHLRVGKLQYWHLCPHCIAMDLAVQCKL